MAGKGILDADMQTVAGWLRGGYNWWRDELRGAIPAKLRARQRRLSAYVSYAGAGLIAQTGRPPHFAVLVDPALCLVRQLTLPPMGEADLARLLAIEAERIFPLPADRLVLAAAADPLDRSRVTVVGLPLEQAIAMVDELRDAGLEPATVGLADPGRPGVARLDFSPGLAAAGVLAPLRDAAARWWALVAFLFACNLGLLLWRDVQSVARLEELVSDQAPAVNAARVISGRISATQRQSAVLAERRRRQDAVAALAAVTTALPSEAWVQRYAWEGGAIRISGYRRQAADVAGALRGSGRFADVRSASAEAIAEIQTGQPFDVTANFVGFRR